MKAYLKNNGFTLIELIIVIAIIGILVAVISISASDFNKKKADTSIKANLNSITKEAEIYFSDKNNYGTSGDCSSGINLFTDLYYQAKKAIDEIKKHSGNNNVYCNTDGLDYAVSAKLRTTDDHWCVDSRGFIGSRATSITASNCSQ